MKNWLNINWKIRFRNRVWLAGFLATVATFVYDLLALFGVTPGVNQDTVTQAISAALTLLTALGVVIDPTTPGAEDSQRAMTYE